MPTNRSRRCRVRSSADPSALTEARMIFFQFDMDMYDNIVAGFRSSVDERQCYEQHEQEIIENCIQHTPCRRPRMWWKGHGGDRPIDPLNDFYNKLAEAEALYAMGEIRPEELPALDHLRAFYGRCRAMERDRI